MPIVQSNGALRRLADPREAGGLWTSSGTPTTWRGYSAAYAQIYATQPSVRVCVDFLARNIAQLGLHVFRRVSDTDRRRLTEDEHDVAAWLEKPNPATTRYRLIEALLGDLGIYFNAYWLKVHAVDAASGLDRIVLVRLPPADVTVIGGLLPQAYEWATASQTHTLRPDQLVVFGGYNPLDPLAGLSPLETLRRTLDGDAAAIEHREAYYHNATRIEGVIERPKDAPKWNTEQKKEWRRQWQERYTGPASVGLIPVLEDGMTWKATSFSAKDSEYINARKLSQEEVARAYHIPLPMIGYLDHATFSNIREQHKQLYADTLGPWNEMIQSEIDRQLVPDARDNDRVYVEFNIAEKLKGSFEEQASALRTVIGRPVMTVNEGRARLNLPQADDPTADEIAPQQGGPASNVAPPPPDEGDVVDGQVVGRSVPDVVAAAVRWSWHRQSSRLQKLPAASRAAALDQPRAMRELAADLTPVLGRRAISYAANVTLETYALLINGEDAFARDREVPPCSPTL